MKVKLSCVYCNSKGEKIGEPGDELEMTPAEAKALVKGGSAVLIEPPKKSEREL
jgi:hypothetical protein